MKRSPRIRFAAACFAAFCAVLPRTAAAAAEEPPALTARLTVDGARPGPRISPLLHGAFFEDINYGADGGLYAELVQNRSFEHRDPLFSWSEVRRGPAAGTLRVADADPLNAANPHYLRLEINAARGGFGVANQGFDGIAVRKGEEYRFSVHARAGPTFRGGLLALLEDEAGRPLGRFRINGLGPRWKRVGGVFRSAGTSSRARLVVLATGASGQVDLDMVSLFPVNTWKRRPNGLRADLVRTLAEMRPGFVRFPGGCIVEGKDLANAYRWKDTIGDVAARPQNWNRWQDANPDSPAAQYYQTYGLGFFEYFQLCEDIGAEPVPVLNCGMACQFQTAETVPLDELGPWVQDALDLIEFANGPATSRWGSKRAAMGHPKPFGMKYLAIGNEQWGEGYFARYRVFREAIKAGYPQITLITTSGPGVDDHWWNLAWDRFRSGAAPAEIVDEHYYRSPQWFLQQAGRYDRYDRTGPKVFAGEYAAHGPGRRNDLQAALAEAAFMTGLVRNADVVHMASYAPLFARVGFTQWRPDLIWFDGTRVVGSPSYHVQALFARHRGDMVLPSTLDAPRVPETFRGKVGVGTWATRAEFKDVRVTKQGRTLFASDFAAAGTNGTRGWRFHLGNWQVRDGALRQTGDATNVRALVGDASWSDYTLSLKARKLGGREGFLVLFQSPDDPATTSWWNLGGWNNTQHGVEVPGVPLTRVPGTIETGRWYDIRVELDGPTVRCYLDGELVQEITRPASPALYAVASREDRSGEVILKVVNPSGRAVETDLRLQNVGPIAPEGTAVVLTADRPDAENSLARPAVVAPRRVPLRGLSGRFRYRFPAHSVTVLRLRPGSSVARTHR
jgi:alpha-L-arabinofuranosidase